MRRIVLLVLAAMVSAMIMMVTGCASIPVCDHPRGGSEWKDNGSMCLKHPGGNYKWTKITFHKGGGVTMP